jgi:hypothetical protein
MIQDAKNGTVNVKVKFSRYRPAQACSGIRKVKASGFSRLSAL